MRGAGIRFNLWRAALYGMMAGGPFVDPAAAQTEEEPEAPAKKYFTLDRLDMYLELEADYSHTQVRQHPPRYSGFKNRQTNRDYSFEERIGFGLTGTVVDPSFITFDGDVSFALTQSRFEERGYLGDENDTESGHLLQYDLRANFFSGKRLSGTVYALSRDDRIPRRFQPTLDETRTGFGTRWDFAHQTFPMTLSYDYLETDRTGNRDPADNEHFTDSTLHYGADWLISDHHRFKLSYEHAENKQNYQGRSESFETTRDLFRLEHELEFGSRHQHDFKTLVHWQEESGDFARDLFEIGPQLTLRHTENLQTLYKYQFNRETYAGLDVETHRADFQLVHQLYSNLTTTVDLFGLYEDIENDTDTTQYGSSVDWQYNRKNPLGHFYANLAVGWDTEEVRGDDGVKVVLDESATFKDPLQITLRNRNILPYTIVVTDLTNRRLFVPIRDYLVLVRGNVVQLQRVASGRIADGDSVLIDYSYRTPQNGQIDTIRVDFGLEQQFTMGLTPYYRFSYRNQQRSYKSTGFSFLDLDADTTIPYVLNLEGETTTGFPRERDRTDHHRLGVRYEKERFTLGTEYEIFDDTVEPYDAFHFNGLVHVLKTPQHTFDASARCSRFFFQGGVDTRNVTMIDAELDHRWQVRENLSTFERMAYRWQDDSVAGMTVGWDVAAGVDYVLGEFTAELTFEYNRLDLPQSDEDDFGVYMRLRRDFPNVLARR